MSAQSIAAKHSMQSVEFYTPGPIVEAARATLGAIDLDPFSCAEANEVVRAARYYDDTSHALHNGWTLDWIGRVFCNPPGGKLDGDGKAKRAWRRLMDEQRGGRTIAGVFVAFSLDLLQTTQIDPAGPLPLDYPICYPRSRVAYRRPGGATADSPPHASCVILVPPLDAREAEAMVGRFTAAFAPIGKVVVPV